MGYASRAGRARTSATNPQAHAICDRCGGRFNLVDLRNQRQWFGTTLKTYNILVHPECYDRPQEQLRAIALPADPVPKANARIEYFSTYETDVRQTSGQNTIDPLTGLPVIQGNTRITQDGNTRTTQATGEPPGGLDQTPGVGLIAVPDDIGANDPGLPYGYTEVPKTGPLR